MSDKRRGRRARRGRTSRRTASWTPVEYVGVLESEGASRRVTRSRTSRRTVPDSSGVLGGSRTRVSSRRVTRSRTSRRTASSGSRCPGYVQACSSPRPRRTSLGPGGAAARAFLCAECLREVVRSRKPASRCSSSSASTAVARRATTSSSPPPSPRSRLRLARLEQEVDRDRGLVREQAEELHLLQAEERLLRAVEDREDAERALLVQQRSGHQALSARSRCPRRRRSRSAGRSGRPR